MRLLLLFTLLSVCLSAFGQKKVEVIVSITNSYHEYTENPFDSAYLNRLFSNLELLLKEKTGDDVRISAESRKRVFFIGFGDAMLNVKFKDAFKGAVAPFQEYTRAYINLRKDRREGRGDYFVSVQSELTDKTAGSNVRPRYNDLRLKTRIKVWNAQNKVIVRHAGRIRMDVPALPFDENNLLIEDVNIVRAFPATFQEMQDIYSKSIFSAIRHAGRERITVAPRTNIHSYDSLIERSTKYRLIANNSLHKTRAFSRWRLFGFYTIFHPKPIAFTRLNGKKQGILKLRERRITDINIQGFGAARYQRGFKMWVEGFNATPIEYAVKSVAVDDFLGISPVLRPMRLIVKDQNHDRAAEFKFITRGPVNHYKKVGRMFSPLSNLEGEIGGHTISVRSSLKSANAHEVWMDGKLTALVAHPVPSRKYVRKGRKYLPFIMYMDQALSEEEESLMLVAFQLNRLSYIIDDHGHKPPKVK